MPPCQIVPTPADEGIYIASESTFYRVLKEEKMLNHRGRRNLRVPGTNVWMTRILNSSMNFFHGQKESGKNVLVDSKNLNLKIIQFYKITI